MFEARNLVAVAWAACPQWRTSLPPHRFKFLGRSVLCDEKSRLAQTYRTLQGRTATGDELTLASTVAREDRLLIVGNPDPIHIGSHLRHAALSMDWRVTLCDIRRAYAAPSLILSLNWHLRDHRPPYLDRFSAEVVKECQLYKPRWLLATGIAPLTATALSDIGGLGITRLNFLTDDPWNPQHHAEWFERALPFYDHVFSPRRANLGDLKCAYVPQVSYLPFAYAPEIHFADPPVTPEERARYDCDVLFFGGADDDRIPLVGKLIDAGINVHLYGGYWERIPRLRSHYKGHVGPEVLRRAVGGAKVTLCLVRRANRDGHVMRTFEAPAMGACMLAEYTEEHVEILGPDGDAVVYFQNGAELVDRVWHLLAQPQERERLKARLEKRIFLGRNTYRDRLVTMLTSNDTSAQVTRKNEGMLIGFK